jgi:hypothetical protein
MFPCDRHDGTCYFVTLSPPLTHERCHRLTQGVTLVTTCASRLPNLCPMGSRLCHPCARPLNENLPTVGVLMTKGMQA